MKISHYLVVLFLALPAAAQFVPNFDVYPQVAVKGVTQTIRLRSEFGFGCNQTPLWCGVAKATIGGLDAPVAGTQYFAEIELTVPDLPAGTLADVVLTDELGNIRRRSGALRIVDPGAPFSPDAFDRVLIPVIYEGPGQKGSQWTTDVWAMNGNNYGIAFMRGPVPQLGAEQIIRIEANAPNGYVLYPAKGAIADLSLNVLVRDLSRQAEALGTELPAVQERDFESRRILLMNIPSDPRFRLTLRAYAFDPLPGFSSTLNYWLYNLETGQQVAFGILPLSPPTDEKTPWHGAIGDLMATHPEIVNKGPLRLSISPLGPHPDARFWAFVSVTNNDTQHVTAITPNR